MKNLNTCFLTGNLTSDAELKTSQDGKYRLVFSIACNEDVKSGDEWIKKTAYIPCVIFGSMRAEKLEQYLLKGTKVALTGKLNYSSWEDDQGNKKSRLDVCIYELEFLSTKTSNEPPSDQDIEF